MRGPGGGRLVQPSSAPQRLSQRPRQRNRVSAGRERQGNTERPRPLRNTGDSRLVLEPLRLAGALGVTHSPDASEAAEGRALGSALGDP